MPKLKEAKVIVQESTAKINYFLISYEVRDKDYNYTDTEFREEFVEYIISIGCDEIRSHTEACILFRCRIDFKKLIKLLGTQVFYHKIFFNMEEYVHNNTLVFPNTVHEKNFDKLVEKIQNK